MNKKICLIAFAMGVLFSLAACTSNPKKSDNARPFDNESLKNANSIFFGYFAYDDQNYYYKNMKQGGDLYKKDKATSKETLLFNTPKGGFLHSINAYQGKLYFVSEEEQTGSTDSDVQQAPSIYCMDTDGKNQKKLIDNVGDTCYVKDNYIYYTSFKEENGDVFYLYRYKISTKESTVLIRQQAENVNVVGDDIYYVGWQDTGDIMKYSIHTGKTVCLAKNQPDIGRMIYHDGFLYFGIRPKNNVEVLSKMDVNTLKIEPVASEKQNIFSTDTELGGYTATNGNLYFVVFGDKKLTGKFYSYYSRNLYKCDESGNVQSIDYTESKDNLYSTDILYAAPERLLEFDHVDTEQMKIKAFSASGKMQES